MFKYFLTDTCEYLALGYQYWWVELEGFYLASGLSERLCSLSGETASSIQEWGNQKTEFLNLCQKLFADT